MIPRQELRDYPAPLTAVRSSNDSTICDSTRDQHLKETFLEVPTALLCLDPIGMRPFPKLISPERVLQVKDFEVSRDNRKENKKLTLAHKATSYLISVQALVRRLSLEMGDWLVSSSHVRVIQIPASYSVVKRRESTRNENQMRRWKTIAGVCVADIHKQPVHLHAFYCL